MRRRGQQGGVGREELLAGEHGVAYRFRDAQEMAQALRDVLDYVSPPVLAAPAAIMATLAVPTTPPELASVALPVAAAAALATLPTPGLPESKAPRRIGWASLLARVFAVDVTVCRKCGGRMRILEVVGSPDAVARVLHGARAPPRPPPPGQLLLLR